MTGATPLTSADEGCSVGVGLLAWLGESVMDAPVSGPAAHGGRLRRVAISSNRRRMETWRMVAAVNWSFNQDYRLDVPAVVSSGTKTLAVGRPRDGRRSR